MLTLTDLQCYSAQSGLLASSGRRNKAPTALLVMVEFIQLTQNDPILYCDRFRRLLVTAAGNNR
jgi:hypothetical protein